MDDKVAEKDLIRLLEAATPPKRKLGFGPYREDYATQEAFEKAKGGPIVAGGR